MTPLERAARVLHEATRQVRYIRDCTQPALPPVERPMPFTEWDDLTDAARLAYADRARAVIEAIREPSEAMWRAGSDSIDGLQRLERGHAYAVEAKRTYAAMIDALLAEGV